MLQSCYPRRGERSNHFLPYFSQKIGFDITSKLSETNQANCHLHEMSNPIFWEK